MARRQRQSQVRPAATLQWPPGQKLGYVDETDHRCGQAPSVIGTLPGTISAPYEPPSTGTAADCMTHCSSEPTCVAFELVPTTSAASGYVCRWFVAEQLRLREACVLCV